MYVDIGKNGLHQKAFVNGHYNGDPVPNASYQMPPSQMHHNHHQQNVNVQQSPVRHDHQQCCIHLQQPVIPQGRPHYNQHQQKIYLQQSTHPPAHREAQHTTPRNYNPMATSTAYIPRPHVMSPQTNGQYVKKQQAPVKIVNSLSKHKIPANSPILWELSQDVREWKFLGRYLDLEEETIDEIDYNTIPNRTRDKALKVLIEWVNSSTPTWEKLGEALLDAKYILLYEKLLELIDKYATG